MKLLALLPAFAIVAAAVSTAGAADPKLGAALPWVTYEAEQARTNGSVLGPDFSGNTPAREASGRQCVKIASAGEFVEFTARAVANGIVVRYSLPDSQDGRGTDATLSLLINGQPQKKLALTSKRSHLYGDYPFKNEPAAGNHRNFWDELRMTPREFQAGAIQPGDVIRIQKDVDDQAAEYLIDLIDLETVPAPIEQPAGSLSVIDFGATPNDQTDDRAALLATISAAKSQKKTVWIPAGQFVMKGAIEITDIAIRGAGMWHTTLVGVDDYVSANRVSIHGTGSKIALSDFAIVGKLNYRNDEEPNDGIGGTFGTGSSVRNLWVEHTKTGAWFVNSDGLLVEGCRFRNTIADGINLCLGARNCIVRDCSTRGTGDDCYAMWPATYAKANAPHGKNKFVNCSAALPWLAQAFAIYGGEGNGVENCDATDISYGAGLYASTTFPTDQGFTGTTTFRNCRLTRAGDGDGAIGTVANRIDLAGVRFEDIDVIDSPRDGIKFTSMNDHVLRDATFERIKIVNAGLSGAGCGIVTAAGAAGSATINDVSILNPKSAGLQENAPAFKLIRGKGNLGVDDEKKSDADHSK